MKIIPLLKNLFFLVNSHVDGTSSEKLVEFIENKMLENCN